MQLVLHTGVHYTEEERLLRCMLRNKDELAQQGIIVPGPSTYRALFRDTLNAMHKTPASEEARDILLDAVLDDSRAERVILSDPNFFRTPSTAVQQGVLYPAAAVRMMRMSQLFPDDGIEIFMGIRNPATLLPILRGTSQATDDHAFWGTRGPLDIRWSETLSRLRESAPEIAITVWCNEDAPLIWSQVMREMAGLDATDTIVGGHDLLATIMSDEGMQRFNSYLDTHPALTEGQERRVMAAFLDKYALPDALEEELDMPGWTDDLVEELTVAYDADVAVIQSIPGVRVIQP